MLRTTILIQSFIDGSFNYPSTPKSTRFLYYLSVYGNLSKNSFFKCSAPVFERKRMQRYNYFRYHPNFSAIIFDFLRKKKSLLIPVKRDSFIPYLYKTVSCNLFLRSLSDQVHKFVEFRRDDNLGTTVTLLTQLGVVALQGIVLTTAASGQALRVNAILILESLNDG